LDGTSGKKHAMVARSVPENGDIVVRQETREGALVYILHAVSGPDQYLIHARDEAVAHAETFAKSAGVRAWFVCGESDFVLLVESTTKADPGTANHPATASLQRSCG
jgi:hypothetical protein